MMDFRTEPVVQAALNQVNQGHNMELFCCSKTVARNVLRRVREISTLDSTVVGKSVFLRSNNVIQQR
jgi:hypothetical protein